MLSEERGGRVWDREAKGGRNAKIKIAHSLKAWGPPYCAEHERQPSLSVRRGFTPRTEISLWLEIQHGPVMRDDAVMDTQQKPS